MKEKRRCRNFHIQIRGYDVVVKFDYSSKKFYDYETKELIDIPVTVCILSIDLEDDITLEFIGKSKCDPRDVYERDKGEEYAMDKALIKFYKYICSIEKDLKNTIRHVINFQRDVNSHCYARLFKYQKQGKNNKNFIDEENIPTC